MSDKKIGFGFKGKYCSGCNTVWEVFTNAGEKAGVIRHPDFPSFGLEREYCSKCGGASTEAKKPSTLADKAAEQRKLLFNKEIEKRKK